jgi:hypothetical protein
MLLIILCQYVETNKEPSRQHIQLCSRIHGLPRPEKKLKIKEINGSQVSKHVPSDNEL